MASNSFCKIHKSNEKRYPYQLTASYNDFDYNCNCADIPPFNALLTFFTSCKECSNEEYVEFESYDQYQLYESEWMCNSCNFFSEKNNQYEQIKNTSIETSNIEKKASDLIYFKSRDMLKFCSICSKDLEETRIIGYIKESLINSKHMGQYATIINKLVQSDIYCNGCFIANASEKLHLDEPPKTTNDQMVPEHINKNDELEQTLNSFIENTSCVQCSKNINKEQLKKHVEQLISPDTNLNDYMIILNDLLDIKLTCTNCLILNQSILNNQFTEFHKTITAIEKENTTTNEKENTTTNEKENTTIDNEITMTDLVLKKPITSDDKISDLSLAIQNELSRSIQIDQIIKKYISSLPQRRKSNRIVKKTLSYSAELDILFYKNRALKLHKKNKLKKIKNICIQHQTKKFSNEMMTF